MTATAIEVSKLDFAHDARRRGLRVYPMESDSAQPAFDEADCLATPDESQLDEWWGENSEYNIGIATDNLLALRLKNIAGAEEVGRLFKTHADTIKTTSLLVGRDGREHAHARESYLIFLVPKGVNVEARTDIVPGVDVLSYEDDVILGP